MELLPVELLEKILIEVKNPRKLLELRLVSKLWYRVIEKLMEKTGRFWEEMSIKRVNCFYTSSVIKNYFPRYAFEHPTYIRDEKIWRGICRMEIKIREVEARLDESKIEVRKTVRVGGRIVKTSVWDNLMAVVTDLRKVHFFEFEDANQPFLELDFEEDITDVIFWYTDSKVVIAVIKLKDELLFWNVETKEQILSDKFNAQHICVGTVNNLFSEYEGLITHYKYENDRVVSDQTSELVVENSNKKVTKIVAMNSNGLTLSVIKYQKIDIYDTRGTNNFVFTVPLSDGSRLSLFDKKELAKFPKNFPWDFDCDKIKFSHAGWYNTASWAIAATYFLTNYLGWRVYDLKDHIDGYVTSTLMYGNLFLLGLSTGKVYIYLMKKCDDLKNLDFCSKNKKELTINYNNQAIISLNIFYSDMELYLVATTESDNYIIGLF